MIPYSVRTTVPPAVEPLTLAQAKAQVRVEHAVDDVLLNALIAAARSMSEVACDRRWLTQTVEVRYAGFPCHGGSLELPVGPVQAVTGVSYADANGDTQALTGSDGWLDHEPPLIHAAGWPTTQAGAVAPVTVTAVVGYGGTADKVPQLAVQAMLLAVGYWYGFRGDGTDPNAAKALVAEVGLPAGAVRLLDLCRPRTYR